MAPQGFLQTFWRNVTSLDLEEKILNAGVLVAIIGIFFPWVSGEWLGGDYVRYSGFGFFTSFLGTVIFCIHAYVLLLTVLPLAHGPLLIKRRLKEFVRLCAIAQATILTLATLSVMLAVTFEFSRMEVNFGIYLTLVGEFVAFLYSWMRVAEQRKNKATDFFHHPEDDVLQETPKAPAHTPMPPPPPPPAPEEHRLYP